MAKGPRAERKIFHRLKFIFVWKKLSFISHEKPKLLSSQPNILFAYRGISRRFADARIRANFFSRNRKKRNNFTARWARSFLRVVVPPRAPIAKVLSQFRNAIRSNQTRARFFVRAKSTLLRWRPGGHFFIFCRRTGGHWFQTVRGAKGTPTLVAEQLRLRPSHKRITESSAVRYQREVNTLPWLAVSRSPPRRCRTKRADLPRDGRGCDIRPGRRCGLRAASARPLARPYVAARRWKITADCHNKSVRSYFDQSMHSHVMR